ncbi:ABC transporter substrate-binding protein [Nostoc sp.]|uniref:ABC transporter substrate-binding protein n=1 Tax=Nostoc sp. TaxID=1180 RepID=UPI002FFCF9E7
MLSITVGTGCMSKNKLPSRLSTSVACILLLLTTACSQGETKSAQSIDANKASNASVVAASNNISTLRIGYVGSSEPTGPLGWAKKKGILERELQKAGFKNVTFARFPNGPDLNEALVAGQLDVGSLGDTPAIVLRARGIETRLLRITQFNTTAWLVAKKNGARSLAELKGQKIATQKGSYMHRYLLGLLAEGKIPQDVKVVHLMTTEAKAALERGDVAAYATSSDLGPFLKSQGFPVLDSSANHKGLSGTSLVVATESFLAKQPDFPQKFNAILTEAAKDLKANSEEYYQYHAQITKYPLDIIKISLPLKQISEEPLPAEGVKLLEGTKNFLVSQGLAKSDFKLTDWVVNKQQR